MSDISRATLGRLPKYLQYLQNEHGNAEYISAAELSRALNLGEVQVRKDLNSICSGGRPKVGYLTDELEQALLDVVGHRKTVEAVIVGAGSLGTALMGFNGFQEFGVHIPVAFDADPAKLSTDPARPILPMSRLTSFCLMNEVKIGIITVPAANAQEVCDKLVSGGIRAIWNFAPVKLKVPKGVNVRDENLALSLAHLKTLTNED